MKISHIQLFYIRMKATQWQIKPMCLFEVHTRISELVHFIEESDLDNYFFSSGLTLQQKESLPASPRESEPFEMFESDSSSGSSPYEDFSLSEEFQEALREREPAA